MNFYQQSIEDVAKHIDVNLALGLSQQEAERRLKLYGMNALVGKKPDSYFMIFIRQFQSPLIYLLVLAAGLIFFMSDDSTDAFIISGVLIFNAFLGTVQEGRSRNILEQLKHFAGASAVVVRDGEQKIVAEEEVVPGDVLVLQDGSRIPADARLFEAKSMVVDEALLTGESEGVRKTAETIVADTLILADQKNMVFKGTYVVAGLGKALVVATGVRTEIGKIQESIQEIDTEMPLKREIDRLVHWMVAVILVICVGLFGIGYSVGIRLSELLATLTALFICVVPEGLPVVLSLALVTGIYRMAKNNILVKRMQGVEALGRADTLIIDKTGTLTRNELVVSRIVTPQARYSVSGIGYFNEGEIIKDGITDDLGNGGHLVNLLRACSLLAHAQLRFDERTKTFAIKGDPIDAALMILVQKAVSLRDRIHGNSYKELYEIPFDAQWKYHAIFTERQGVGTAYLLGSPEVVYACAQEKMPILQEEFDRMLDRGLRVLAIAQKRFDPPIFSVPEEQKLSIGARELATGLELLGLIGLQDAIRPEVSASIKQAQESGLHVIMATGDHLKTALFVARETGIYTHPGDVLLGNELEALDQEQMDERVRQVTIYARVTPLQKLSIIEALHRRGRLVAMTGDGVNDAPALIAADLGIAMGGIGTEVAKQAADIVLLDDSFTSIVRAIEQGRHIFYTLRRVVLYFFATNFGEILVVIFALLLRIPLPITAAQILWLNLVTDGFLDMALTMEPQEPGLLQQRWLRRARLVNPLVMIKMIYMAIPMGVGALIMFLRYYATDLTYARTATLITMAMFQWFNAWNCRSETKSVFQLGLFSNPWLLLAIGGVFVLQLVLLYVPIMQRIFDTVPLTCADWVLIFLLSSTLFMIEELRKWLMRWVGVSKKSNHVMAHDDVEN
ncbi:HAD-IC family P-type ATPase [Candidatus Dependentiae bacterium]|nr:HAD-IC family P-type ATPase [Candidatus Dependentiae bacterium]